MTDVIKNCLELARKFPPPQKRPRFAMHPDTLKMLKSAVAEVHDNGAIDNLAWSEIHVYDFLPRTIQQKFGDETREVPCIVDLNKLSEYTNNMLRSNPCTQEP